MSAVNYDNLLIGDYESITEVGVLLDGESVVRGQALGAVDANGKIVGFAGSESATESFYGIAAEDAVASGADGTVLVYTKGVFSEGAIEFEDPSSDDIETIRADARTLGIYFKKTLGA
jgi:hypothetical protein